jgi:hypothetical protein
MSSDNRGPASDLTEIRGAFSSKAWRVALDNRIRKYPRFFEFLWQARLWWIIAAALTFVLPVLRNDNTYALSYSRSTNLYGFDLLVPMLSQWDSSNVISIESFSVNPLALIIYGLAALHLYLFFVRSKVSPRLTAWHGAIQTILTILFPFLDIPVLNFVLPKFNSYWHVQPPLFGFWLLLFSGLVLWGGAYGRILRGLPLHEPPPLG